MPRQGWNREGFLSLVMEQAKMIVYVCDLQINQVLYANDLAKKVLNIQEGQVCCANVQAFFGCCGCHRNKQLLDNPNEVIHTEWYNPRMERWFERHIQMVQWIDGRLVRLEMAFDITEQIHFGNNGWHQSAFSRLILESIGDAVIVTDGTGKITMMNPLAEQLTGWKINEALGKDLTQVFHIINTQSRQLVQNPVAKVLATGHIVGLANHTSLISRDGQEYHIADSAAPVKDKEGHIHGVILVFRDISEEYRQQEALRISEERFRTLVETSINAVALHEVITDESGRVVDYRFLEVNKAFEAFTGLTASQLIGRTVLEVLPGTEQFWIDTYGEVALTGVPREFEEFSREIGRYFWVRVYSPRPGQFVTVFTDITDRKQLENKLREMAYQDVLTGLHNRRYLESQLSSLDVEDNLPLSVIIGDVNGLKIINDSMGHGKGDRYLKQVASVFRQVARSDDLVVRWGGDEFILIMPRTTAQEAHEVCMQINELAKQRTDDVVMLSIALGHATKIKAEDRLVDVVREAETRMYQQKINSTQSRRSALVMSLQQALAEKSHETEEHARNLQKLAVKLAQRIGLTNGDVVTSSLVALLHDIGKLAISENILDKPGPLSPEEWEIMKQHSEIGYRIVASSPDLLEVAAGVLYHHERWDGTGYPHGLAGENIPISARIVALVDALDAMTTNRPYRAALSLEQAKQEISECAGTHFDPTLTAELLAILDEEIDGYKF